MIIDCHTHCYATEQARDPRRWAEQYNESHWADLVAPLDRRSIQDWATPNKMLRDMDAAGIDQSILLGWYWEHEATCRWHNDLIAKWVQTAPDRFIGFASILPNANVIDQLEQAKSLGLRGVGELHFSVQNFDHQSPHWQQLAQWCTAESWPVNLHATEAAGHPHPGSIPTSLNEFIYLAESAPELTLILAHWGGGLPFFEQNPRLRKALRNVVYDTAASPLLYDSSVFQHTLELVGPEKLLYGSDYPLRLFPRQQAEADFSSLIQQIAHCNLPKTAQAQLLGGNCARILASTRP